MKVDGVKITWIAQEQEAEVRDLPNFASVCQYGSIRPEVNEVGAIMVQKGIPVLHPSGLWQIRCKVAERFFIVEPS